MPEIIADLGKDKTALLFNTIVAELKKNGLYSDDVLPEYVVLLLANKHPKEKILSDLEGLLGPEVATAFTTWLFEEVERLKVAPEAMPMAPPVLEQPDQVMKSAPVPRSAFPEQHNRLFTSAMKYAAVDSRQPAARRREPGRSDMVPEEGFRTRRNRSVSPIPMQDESPRRSQRVVVRHRYEDDRDRPSHQYQQHLREDRERGRSRGRDQHPERLISRADGNIKIEVRDARELLSRPPSNRYSRSPPRRGIARRAMDIDPTSAAPTAGHVEGGEAGMPAVDEPPKIKCRFFPDCKNEECPYYHPKRICTYFPNCTRGQDCTFIHPPIPCKYQQGCQNPVCNYQHAKPSLSSTVLCKFYPNCVNAQCQFLHPVETPCKFGAACTKVGCHFKHPEGHAVAPKSKIFAPCMFGPRCAKPGCPYLHPTPEAAPDSMVVEPITAAAAPPPAIDAPTTPIPVANLQ